VVSERSGPHFTLVKSTLEIVDKGFELFLVCTFPGQAICLGLLLPGDLSRSHEDCSTGDEEGGSKEGSSLYICSWLYSGMAQIGSAPIDPNKSHNPTQTHMNRTEKGTLSREWVANNHFHSRWLIAHCSVFLSVSDFSTSVCSSVAFGISPLTMLAPQNINQLSVQCHVWHIPMLAPQNISHFYAALARRRLHARK
jgi:hypothetical protein